LETISMASPGGIVKPGLWENVLVGPETKEFFGKLVQKKFGGSPGGGKGEFGGKMQGCFDKLRGGEKLTEEGEHGGNRGHFKKAKKIQKKAPKGGR